VTTDAHTHRTLGIEAFNSSWEILGRPWDEITPAEAEELIRRAYASAYHWSLAEGRTPPNAARSEWLLSRAWLVQGNAELSLRYAQRSLEMCETNDLTDFDLAYGHEAVARAYAGLGDEQQATAHRDRAKAVPIAESEDRSLFESDVAAEPWFGL
jgi:hypothetical protein